MFRNILCVATCMILGHTSLSAQTLDLDLEVEAVTVTADGNLIIRNGESEFSCSVVSKGDSIAVENCAAIGASEPASLTNDQWRDRIRDAMLDNDCKLSTLGAVVDVIEREAIASGMSSEDVTEARAEIASQVDEVFDRMLWEGQLTVRDGEFALDACK